jgi:hypothetical protein
MALPKLEGYITIPTGGWAVSVTEVGGGGTVAVTVAAGNYFLTSTTALLSAFATALDDSALTGDYTVSIDDTADSATGKVTISATGITSFAIVWTSTTFRDALGFDGNISATLTSTGANQSPYIHLPSVKRMPARAPEGTRGIPITDATTTVSPSGQSVGIQYGTRYVDSFGFMFLIGFKTWATYDVVTNEALETFWLNTIGAARPFRYYPDRATDGTYSSYRALSPGMFPAVPAISTWTSSAQSLWHVMFDVCEWTT